MDIDEGFSEVVGAFGKYQISIYVILSVYVFTMPAFSICTVFIGANITELASANVRVRNDSTFLIEWDLLGKAWISDLTQSVYFGGFLFGVMFFGQVSDYFGRRKAMLLGYWLFSPLCLGLSYSNTWQIFALLRFLNGFVGGGATLVQYVYLQEIVGCTWWAVSGSIQNSFYAFGIMLFSFMAYFVPAWRHLLRIMTGIQILPLLFLWFLPESPRWLYSKGRLQDAETTLVSMAKKNGIRNPVISLTSRRTSCENDKTYTFLDLFAQKERAKRLIVMAYLWFVNSLVYYALTLAVGDTGNNLYVAVALSALIELPIVVVGGIVINRKWCGRKRGVYSALFVSGVACLGLMAFKSAGKTNGKLALGLLGKMMISLSFNTLYVYAPELFPTCMRNVAIGSMSMCARIGGIFASFSKSLIMLHPTLGYFLFGIAGLSAGLLSCLLPETLGVKPLDGDDPIDKIPPPDRTGIYQPINRSDSEQSCEENEDIM